MIKQTITKLEIYFDEIIIISNCLKKWKSIDISIPVYPDIIKDIGPLGGIYTAISNINKGNDVFMVACDMPFLDIDIIKSEVDFFYKTKCNILVPKTDNGFIEPLHSIYSYSILPFLESHLKNIKKYSIRSFLYGEYPFKLNFFNLHNTKKIEKAFTNINTQHELKNILE